MADRPLLHAYPGATLLAATVLLGSAVACDEPGSELPSIGSEVEALEGVRFGLEVRELMELRPDVWMDDKGIYREDLGLFTSVGYGFLPWVEGGPPSARARLEGVEIRTEMSDSLRLRSAWTEMFDRIEAWSEREPECAMEEGFRFRRRRAFVPDSIRVTLLGDVVEAGDGQAYEGYLTLRFETRRMVDRFPGGRMESRIGHSRTFECP